MKNFKFLTELVLMSLSFIMCASCSEDEPVNGTPEEEPSEEVTPSEPGLLRFYPKVVNHDNLDDSVTIIGTESPVVTIDKIRFEKDFVNFDTRLEVGDSLEYDWLTIKLLDKALEVHTVPTDWQGEVVVFCSGLNKDSLYVYKCHLEWLGPVEGQDRIKATPRELEVPAEGGTYTITTQDDGWWFTEVKVGDNHYRHPGTLDDFIGPICIGHQILLKENEGAVEWLYIIRNHQEITVRVEPNSGAERTFMIGLELGDFFNRIYGTQAGV